MLALIRQMQQQLSFLEKKLDKKARIELLPRQIEEVPITYADISKSKSILGFTPRISLDEGLDQFLSWYLEFYTSQTLA